MTLQVAFRPAARDEFIEAAARYDAQRPGLGDQFIAEIERCVAAPPNSRDSTQPFTAASAA